MFNKAQPPRPRYHPETGVGLLHRTMPKHIKKIPRFTSFTSQIVQMRLYRAACNGEIPSGVAIGDLYDHCFDTVGSLVSKHHMGNAVVHAVMNEPRLLKNSKATGARMIYIFQNETDLQYGLEWQICTWFYHYLREVDSEFKALGSNWEEVHPRMVEELQMLAEADSRTYKEMYEDTLLGMQHGVFIEPDWREKFLTYEEDYPDKPESPPKKPLKSLLTDRDTRFAKSYPF